MTTQERRLVQSEIGALKKMLAQLPESSVIDRMSLEARKRSLEKELASQRQAGAEEVPPGYKRTEVGVVPEDWEIRWLDDIASIRNQKILPSNVDPDTLCVELEHIGQNNGRLLEGSTARNSTSSKYRFFAGDVLFGRLRSYLRKYWHASRDGICTTEIWPLVVNAGRIDSKFLYAIIQSDRFIEAASISYGTHMPRADWTVMKNFEVCLPPLPEQRAIAAALSDADRLIVALNALIAKKRAIKQAAMQQLLTGKKRLPGFEGEWVKTDLRSLCASITDGTHYTPKYVDVGIPFYSVETLTQNEFTNTKHISPEEHEELIKRCKPERGDILLTRIGSLGETKLIDWDVNASIYVSLALLKVKADVCSEYLYAYTKSRQFVSDVGSRALLNASPKKINMEDIGDIPISAPPSREEQHTIGTLLLDMDAEITAIECRREKAQQIKQGMMQQLLTGKVRLVESGCKGAQPYAE